MKLTEILNTALVQYGSYAILLGLVAIFGFYTFQKIKKQTGSRFVACIFLIAFLGMASVAFPTSAEKKRDKEPITFLQTDVEVTYLIDNGSYVSNNIVHLDFKHNILLPPRAVLFLDYIPKSEPPDANNFTTYMSGSLSEFINRLPIEFEFENAISNRWVFYTTYTPGPNVHTNGVAVAEFIKATEYDNVAVPKRSTIWEDGERIYPATEKINLLEEIGEEVQ